MDEKPTEAAPSPEPEVEEVGELVAEPVAEVSAEAAPVVELDELGERSPRGVPLWMIIFEAVCLVGMAVGIIIKTVISAAVGDIIISSSAFGFMLASFLTGRVLIRKDTKKIDDKEISNG